MEPQLFFSPKTICIVGATGGIGGALTSHDAFSQSQKILHARNDNESTFSRNASSHWFSVDLTNTSKVEEVFFQIAERFSTIDVLINAAGIGISKPIEMLSQEDIITSFQINSIAPFIIIKQLLPSLRNATNAKILNIGSGLGKTPAAGRTSYVASKFALRGLSLSLTEELKNEVQVTHIDLGSVLTSFGEGLESRKQQLTSGKKYLDPNKLATELITILQKDNLEPEYTIYPSERPDLLAS